MKTLTLFQPYASLIMLGLKTFETRSWDAKKMVGQTILIHAAKTMPNWARDKCLEQPFSADLTKHGLDARSLPKGVILGAVDLINTVSSEMWLEGRTSGKFWMPNGTVDTVNVVRLVSAEWQREFAYGDYSPNRFAFELANPNPLIKPIPATGYQRWWNFDL